MVRTNFFAIGRTTAVSPTILNKDAKFRDRTVQNKLPPTKLCQRNCPPPISNRGQNSGSELSLPQIVDLELMN